MKYHVHGVVWVLYAVIKALDAEKIFISMLLHT